MKVQDHPSTATKCSRIQALAAVKTLISYIGDNPNRDGLVDTPERVLKSYQELFAGYNSNPKEILAKTFTDVDEYQEMVLVKNINISSYCEHHIIPILGHASIAYIPNGRVVGISKLARVADIFARRLQVQERLTSQIANTINEVLQPKGVAVLIDANHQCMSTRGANKIDSSTVTSCMLGDFKKDAQLRNEFYTKIKI